MYTVYSRESLDMFVCCLVEVKKEKGKRERERRVEIEDGNMRYVFI